MPLSNLAKKIESCNDLQTAIDIRLSIDRSILHKRNACRAWIDLHIALHSSWRSCLVRSTSNRCCQRYCILSNKIIHHRHSHSHFYHRTVDYSGASVFVRETRELTLESYSCTTFHPCYHVVRTTRSNLLRPTQPFVLPRSFNRVPPQLLFIGNCILRRVTLCENIDIYGDTIVY